MNHIYVLIFIVILTSGCGRSQASAQNIDSFAYEEITAYLQPYFFSGDSPVDENGHFNYWQDSDGHTLYISGQNHLYLISSNRNEPMCLSYPKDKTTRTYWYDPQGQIHYLPNYALPEADKDVSTTIDRQSGYFFQSKAAVNTVYVGSMEHSDDWIFKMKPTGNFWPGQVASKNDVVYLLDHRNTGTLFFSYKNCWAFAPDPENHQQYIKIDEFCVDGSIIAVDPASPRLLCQSSPGGLGAVRRFLYDLKTHKDLGWLSGDDVWLFLNENWLTTRLARRSR